MRAIYYRALPGDFETHPVGTVKDLKAEIERLREELNVTRLQRDAKLSSQTAVDEAAAREIERLRLEFYHYENENTYKGNSIRHWYDKAMAYKKRLDEMGAESE